MSGKIFMAIVVCVILFPFTINAQGTTELIPKETKGKWGFVNQKGKKIVAPKYDEVDDFQDGLAIVVLGGKMGLVDQTGNEIVTPKYDKINSFQEGLAIVTLGGKAGFIDRKGNEVVTPKYGEADKFQEGLAVVILDEKVGFINQSGTEIIPCTYDCKIITNNENGAKTDKIYIGNFRFSEGIAKVLLHGKWGIIDKTGKAVIPIKYDNIKGFSEGLTKVMLDGKWGAFDTTGKEVIPVKYDVFGDFSDDGKAYAAEGNKWSIIDRAGTEKGMTHRTGLPINIEYLDTSYPVIDFTVSMTNNKTTVTVITTGDLFRVSEDGKLIAPVNCGFVSGEKKYLSKTISLHGNMSAVFVFETSDQPDAVIFYPGTDTSKSVTIDYK